MKKVSAPNQVDGVSGLRQRRHHFLDAVPADEVTIARDICGVQAQLMSAAYLQFWTRNHALTREKIENALWKRRTLIKTSLMRQTLHIIPSDEFPLYIAALRPSRLAAPLRIMARCGITREEAEELTTFIVQALSDGPLARTAINAAVRPRVSKRVRAWMDKVWSIMRLPVAEGRICYGRGLVSEKKDDVSFILVDQWLPKMKMNRISAGEAQFALFRKYLRAYGPATLADFSHWSGIPMQEVRLLQPLLGNGFVEFSGQKNNRYLLQEDVASLKKGSKEKSRTRLLPYFDPYQLAHREKHHLLGPEHYKRVYRNQGWISPVVLIDGAIAGVWFYKFQNKTLAVTVEPFKRLSREPRSEIAGEAEQLALFFGLPLKLQFD